MKKQSKLVLFTILALALAGCGAGGGSSDGLTGVKWEWTAMQETVPASQSVVPPAEVGEYTITFNEDGTYILQADCNQGSGQYSVDGSSLTIEPGALTLAFCGEQSSDVIFLASLDKVSSYAIVDGELQLKFPDDSGKMDFQNGGTTQ